MKNNPLLNTYKILFTVFVILLSGSAFAQQQKIDSLSRELNHYSKQDTGKVGLILELAGNYYFSNSDSTRVYAQRALELSQKLDYPKGECLSYDMLGKSYFLTSDYDSALIYYALSMEICRKHKMFRGMALVYHNIGNIYLRRAIYPDALNYYDSAIDAAKTANNTDAEVLAKSSKASVFSKMGNYPRALEYYLQSLDLYKKQGKENDIAAELSNIAIVYFRLGDYKNAVKYNRESIALNKKLGNKLNTIANLANYALFFDAQEEYDSSIASLKEGLDLAVEMKNIYLQNLLKGNLAECYLKKGMLDKALPLYKESEQVSAKLNDVEGLAVAQFGIGEILTKQGKNTEGINYMQKALALSKEAGLKEEVLEISEKLADAYEKTGNLRQALNYHKMSNAYEDSIAKEKSLEEADRIRYNYELQSMEQRIALLEKDNAIEASKKNNAQILLIASLVGVILLIIIVYILNRNIREERQRQKVILAQKEEIEEQAHKLEELNNLKDTTFSVLSHDLRSPVAALTSTMMLLDENVITPEEFAEHKQELNYKLQSVSLLLDNLLQWAKSHMKGVHTLDIEKLSIRVKALKCISVLKDAARQKNITLANDVKDGIYAYGDRTQVEMILRNIVSNAVKFTPDGGTVTISAKQENGTTSVSVKDTGIGMSAEQAENLFKGEANISTKGTMGEKGTGIGLKLSYEFAVKNGGDIIVSSKEGEGTTFTVHLPGGKGSPVIS